MKFDPPLLSATLVKRYKRFLADVTFANGHVVTVHCPNPGAMTGLAEPGARIWVSEAGNPKRKLKHTWELVEADGGIVGLNTGLPNGLVAEAIEGRKIEEFRHYSRFRREVRYGENSRIDLLLYGGKGRQCFVEVKNVHLRRQPGLAEFPDSVTARGAKHLHELANMVAAGHRAVMIFVVQRNDCANFKVAADIDPNYQEAFEEAAKAGVEMLCYGCSVDVEGVEIRRPLNVILP